MSTLFTIAALIGAPMAALLAIAYKLDALFASDESEVQS
jgi:hypothetical protein